ncbi:hypothetical protein CQW23_29837 [Capsicum baccatum]|uniref:Calmodulin-binding domain-containing protein n=1 Tax=Capsicum baccatum TaxID=33114 RepID=A0A2G2VC17_CAPBA|nr:hypothetical protein CQW23_29837 [Capsicum baccatum]
MRLHGWSLQYQILGIFSLVLSLLAGTVLYVKRRSDKTLHPLAVSSKKFSTHHVVKEKHSSQNLPTEVDVVGASRPSEVSIFKISSSHRKKYPKFEDDEAQSIEKKPRKSNRRESLAASKFSMGSPSYGSFTTYERITTKNCQGSQMMAEDNFDEPASPITSVKNDSMAEDNTDELVSPVTSVKNDSMAENNIDELVSPVNSVKNDSAGSKPDKISTIKPRSMSIGNKVLPCYRISSSTSSYNAGNTKSQSTGKLNAPDSRQDVIPHYLRDSTGSCHDFCKYGRKHSSEVKPRHTLSKRKNKLPADEQSPAWTLVGEAKKGTLVNQKLSTPPGSVLGEKKKVTGVEQKPSTSLGSMLGEAKKRTVVIQKTSTTSGSNQSDAKKGILDKQKLSTPPVNILEEGKKVNEVYRKPSAPQESVLKDEKKVTMVEKKPFSPPGCMEGGIDEVTVVEQNLSTPPGSMLVEGKKEAVVNQRPSSPPGSILG